MFFLGGLGVKISSTDAEVELIYWYTWKPNDTCFDWKGPCFGGLKPQNRGQTGSRYIYIYPSLVFFGFCKICIWDCIKK